MEEVHDESACLSVVGQRAQERTGRAKTHWRLVEIMGRSFCPADWQRLNALSFHGNDVVLILENAFDQQELVVYDHGVILRE